MRGLFPLSSASFQSLSAPQSLSATFLAETNRDCLDFNLYGDQVEQNAILLLEQLFFTDRKQCVGKWRLEIVFIYVGSSSI